MALIHWGFSTDSYKRPCAPHETDPAPLVPYALYYTSFSKIHQIPCCRECVIAQIHELLKDLERD